MDPMKGSIHVANPRQNEYEIPTPAANTAAAHEKKLLDQVWCLRRLEIVPGEVKYVTGCSKRPASPEDQLRKRDLPLQSWYACQWRHDEQRWAVPVSCHEG